MREGIGGPVMRVVDYGHCLSMRHWYNALPLILTLCTTTPLLTSNNGTPFWHIQPPKWLLPPPITLESKLCKLFTVMHGSLLKKKTLVPHLHICALQTFMKSCQNLVANAYDPINYIEKRCQLINM